MSESVALGAAGVVVVAVLLFTGVMAAMDGEEGDDGSESVSLCGDDKFSFAGVRERERRNM